MRSLVIGSLLLIAIEAQAQFTVRALKINVEDMNAAVAFYRDKLGFEIRDGVVVGLDDELRVLINRVKRVHPSGLGFTLQVNDLDVAIATMKAKGVEFAGDVRIEGVGNAISIRDPFGRPISLMHQTIRKVEPFREPRLYNFGFRVPDMARARAFYEKLGFVALTERYLPRDLPLGDTSKHFAFMLHARPDAAKHAGKGEPMNSIVFGALDFAAAEKTLRAADARILRKSDTSITFADPFGNVSEVVK
jgi:catechol 2,3-dioxygenase-like lactoylglutathione lyase family enzyme